MWARRDPTAVIVGDGSVLVVGEQGGKYEGPPEGSRAAEVWDPRTATWRETEFLPTPRDDFGAVALQDGRVLVAGGWNAGFVSYSSAYLFDGRAGTWTKTGLMGTARAAPAIAVLRDGRVLVAGGGYYTGVRPMASAPGAVLAAAGIPAGDRRGASVPLLDTWPGPNGRGLATAELFDPATGRWTATGAMRRAMAPASAVMLADGRVLVVGTPVADAGGAVGLEMYDPTTGRFSAVSPPPNPNGADLAAVGVAAAVAEHASLATGGTPVAMSDGSVLFVGTVWDSGACWMSRTLRFEPAGERWSDIGPPSVTCIHEVDGQEVTEAFGTKHPDAVVVGLPEGRVLVAGGMGDDGLGTRMAEVLDVASGTWTAQPPMPGARAHAAAVALRDGSVLVIGGWSNGGDGWPVPLGDTFRFIPATR